MPSDLSRSASSSNMTSGNSHKVQWRPESLYYDMSGKKYLYIFNHYEYMATPFFRNKAPLTRVGTHRDVEALEGVFGNLGFEIETFPDLTYQNIIDKVSEVSRRDHSTTSCLAIAILTHGDRGGLLTAADKPYSLGDLTILLENGHPSLINKPKLFFIQACRGNLVDGGRPAYYDCPEEDHMIIVPAHSDFLFMYSTVEDHVSWRDEDGSWMIQELCSVIKAYSENFDILHLITIATRNVAYSHISHAPEDSESTRTKQTPETRYTLTKIVKF